MPVTPTWDLDLFTNVAVSILDSIADILECNGQTVPTRRFVGFDRPPQDCCPELVAWIGNIRTWSSEFPDQHIRANLLQVNEWAFDVTIRIGRCYVDITEKGPMDIETIQKWTRELNRDAHAMYVGWVANWHAGNVGELTSCDLVAVSPINPYHEGGCAGWEFTITIGLD